MNTLMIAASAAALSFAVLPDAAHADDLQNWEAVTVQVALGGPWKVTNETVARSSDAKGFYELENNLLLGYKLNKHITLWAGYTHNPNYSHGNFTVMEHRGRQQITFDNVLKVGPVNLSGRLRLEERWRDGVAGTGWRLRPYVKASMPFANHGKTALVVTHESFLNLNKTSFQKVSGEDRMRNFVGINSALMKHISVEMGYLEQHGFVPAKPDTNDHVVSVALTASF